MAEIVYGIGCSHSPLLATGPEEWDLRADDDRANPSLMYRGSSYRFDELRALRHDEGLEEQITVAVRRKRHALNQRRLDELGRSLRGAELDVLVVFGDDQQEVLLSDNMPGFLVFTGDGVPFTRTSEERLAAMSDGVRVANWARIPDHDMVLPGAPDLAHHLVRAAVKDGFDVSVSDRFLARSGAEDGVGHAFGFFYHRLLDDFRDTPRLATLPIFINTFFPPNQPPLWRALEFGRTVGHAIRSWDSDARVGVAASGGFSHFVIDEELDQRMLSAIAAGDTDAVLAEPETNFQSGTSEIKNWIAAMGALEGSGLAFRLLDYVPCYRSLAGTGNAMVFALWEAPR